LPFYSKAAMPPLDFKEKSSMLRIAVLFKSGDAAA
jgi:hypothetical protein